MLWISAVTLQATEQPNFVVIMADDLGYGDLGCFGNHRIKTPQLNQMAAEGLRLTDFHSSGAVCSPTRAGLLTGRYQQRAGIPTVIYAADRQATHVHGLQEQELTFAEQLGSAGYDTAIFGKWHLGYYPQYNPTRHGFHTFRGYVSGNVDFFSHVDQAGKRDWWHDTLLEDEPGYTTHLITRHAIDFIQQHRERPFCLYVAYEPPHYPYQGPHDAPIREVGTSRSRAELDQSSADIQRAYREMIEAMDTGLGEIFAALKAQHLDEQTLVLFFSDNGATRHGSNGSLRGHKGQLWEGGHRVPLIARWPGRIQPGRVSAETAITLDVMPTLLAAAGVPASDERPLDGVSLLDLLTNAHPLPKRQLCWAHGNQRAARDGPWKLLVHPNRTDAPQLFDLTNDLSETQNLAGNDPVRVAEMMRKLSLWETDVQRDATPQPTSLLSLEPSPREAEHEGVQP